MLEFGCSLNIEKCSREKHLYFLLTYRYFSASKNNAAAVSMNKNTIINELELKQNIPVLASLMPTLAEFLLLLGQLVGRLQGNEESWLLET